MTSFCGRHSIALLLLILTNPLTASNITTSNDILQDVLRMAGLLLSDCMSLKQDDTERFLILLQHCLERRSLQALDRTLNREVIELTDGVELVSRKNRIGYREAKGELDVRAFKFPDAGSDWKSQVTKRMFRLLETHVLKIHLNGQDELHGQARRRKDNSMMSVVIFSLIAMTMIVIPMGFQFLAVLGGKALLLAKMALILASIQGLKKMATSNWNYGFYQTAPEYGPHEHGNCKTEDGLLTYECRGLESDDSSDNEELVYFEFKFEDLSGHYDRHWPYEMNGIDVSNKHYPDHYSAQQPSGTDLLHPYPQPRRDRKRTN